MVPTDTNWWDYVNPFHYLGDAAGQVAASAWTAAMLGLWNAGLWLLKLVLTLEDAFLTPDLSEHGPGATVYPVMFWIAGTLVVVMLMVQLGLAAFRRDGRSLARVVVGAGQYVMVWAAWIAYAVAVLAAAGGLTRALMQSMLHVDAMSVWQPWAPFSTSDITDGTIATVLGLMGIFLVLAAIGHALVMLTRAGALLVLSAATPITAAGLVSDAGRSWFWKSLRWFHAAALTPVLMTLTLGLGVQMTSGVALGLTDSLQTAIGTAVPGVFLILIGCFSPLALFKLLAFVEPGTSSGAALRTGLAAQGGVQGLLRAGTDGTTGAASATDQLGRASGEDAADTDTGSRFARGASGLLGGLGAAGQTVAAGLGAASGIGAKAAVLGADMTNLMGAGHNTYVPDFAGSRGQSPSAGPRGGGPRDDDNPDINGSGTGGGSPEVDPTSAVPPATGAPHPAGPVGAGTAPTAGPGAGGAGAAGGGAAAAVPIVPV